jgi:hypothetical protein
VACSFGREQRHVGAHNLWGIVCPSLQHSVVTCEDTPVLTIYCLCSAALACVLPCTLQEQLRAVNEARELDVATFRPDLSPSRLRAGESFAVSVFAMRSSTAHCHSLEIH